MGKVLYFRTGSYFRCGSMLFDLKPKVNRSDLFDFDQEIGALTKFIKEPSTRFIVIKGLRRTGKTSLILSTLNALNVPYVFIDIREIIRSRRGLYMLLSNALNDFIKRYSKYDALIKSIVNVLSLIRGINVAGLEISIKWGKDRPLLTDIFKGFNMAAGNHNTRIIVVIDEAQRLAGSLGVEVWNAIAYAYDFLSSLTFIITGSEVGVLNLILNNPESPLFGRGYVEVSTRELTREESIRFLKLGFSESKVMVNDNELNDAVDKLGGIIGWLTYYGYVRSFGGRDLESIINDAVNLAKQELENFLKTRVNGRRYRVILRSLANDVREWGRLKRTLEDYEGVSISDRVIYEILTTLKNHSIINNNLEFTDPVVREAARVI